MASMSRFLTKKLRLTVNEAKSAVARPEERKFLGFSISNDGSERRIAPKALDKFKMQVRDMTRRTRGISVLHLIEDLRPYLLGWRGYFGFCQTPRVLSNLEAWIRRILRSYLCGSGRTGPIASKNCAVVAYQSSLQRSPPVRRRGSGACQDTGRFNKHCATTTSTHSASPDSMCLSKPNPFEPPWYETRMPGGGGGVAPRGVPLSRSSAQRRHRTCGGPSCLTSRYQSLRFQKVLSQPLNIALSFLEIADTSGRHTTGMTTPSPNHHIVPTVFVGEGLMRQRICAADFHRDVVVGGEG
jgi:hypothetical protein